MQFFGWLPYQNRLDLSFKLSPLSLTITLKQVEMPAISSTFLPFLLNREVEQELYFNKGNSFSSIHFTSETKERELPILFLLEHSNKRKCLL